MSFITIGIERCGATSWRGGIPGKSSYITQTTEADLCLLLRYTHSPTSQKIRVALPKASSANSLVVRAVPPSVRCSFQKSHNAKTIRHLLLDASFQHTGHSWVHSSQQLTSLSKCSRAGHYVPPKGGANFSFPSSHRSLSFPAIIMSFCCLWPLLINL